MSHGPDVVFLPGFMLDGSLWDDMQPYLPADRIVHRGRLEGSTIEAMAANVLAEAPDTFILVGFSLGGFVARQVAGMAPDRVRGLALVASSARDDAPERLEAKRVALRSLNSTTFNGLGIRSIAPSVHPSRAQDMPLLQRLRAMSVSLGYEAFVHQSLLDRSHIPTQFACPTLVVAASDDALRSMEEAEELRGLIAGSEFAVVEETGHMIPMEKPRELAELLAGWVATRVGDA
ncbi:alpha/beta hydrolase [Luteibacter aegosomaticola]|uniref:alpha/beta fold hydrolase n=1 Tax=Luteibacter aegosomaticola TaxID=2911538 RepID=UPI001FF974F3|nr:alpha/beta hydrolase [Luteibacter aegosomaticola]UPG88099.1 alpha/beta hydrolase [Luteibacter aegosomaticola]